MPEYTICYYVDFIEVTLSHYLYTFNQFIQIETPG